MRKRELKAAIDLLGRADDDNLERIVALEDRLVEVERHVMSRGRDVQRGEPIAAERPAPDGPRFAFFCCEDCRHENNWCSQGDDLYTEGLCELCGRRGIVGVQPGFHLPGQEKYHPLRAENAALRDERDALLLAKDDLVSWIELAVRRLGEDGGGETTIKNARGVLARAFERFAPKPGAEAKAWAERQKGRDEPESNALQAEVDTLGAELSAATAVRERLRKSMDEAVRILQRHDIDAEVGQALATLLDALRLDRSPREAERSRLCC